MYKNHFSISSGFTGIADLSWNFYKIIKYFRINSGVALTINWFKTDQKNKELSFCHNLKLTLQPDGLKPLIIQTYTDDAIEIIFWNIKGLQNQVAKRYKDSKIRVCGKNSFPLR